jgi:hypothetical protein
MARNAACILHAIFAVVIIAVCKKVGGHAICINFFAQLARAISPQPGRGFL